MVYRSGDINRDPKVNQYVSDSVEKVEFDIMGKYKIWIRSTQTFARYFEGLPPRFRDSEGQKIITGDFCDLTSVIYIPTTEEIADIPSTFNTIRFYTFNGRKKISIERNSTITTDKIHTLPPSETLSHTFDININSDEPMGERISKAFAYLVNHFRKEEDAF